MRVADLGILSLLVAGALASNLVQAADLMAAYRLAQSNDPTFEAASYAFDAAREKEPQALAGLLPTVQLTGNRDYNDLQAKFATNPQTRRGIYSWGWNVQLTQPLFRLQNWMAYSESEAQVAEAQAEFVKAQQDLILRLSKAYFDILVAQADVKAAASRQLAMEEQGKAARRNYALGTASVTDYHEAHSKAEWARAELVAARNELETKETALEMLTGKELDDLAPLAPGVTAPSIEPDNAAAWVEQARANNPNVRMGQAAVKAADSDVGKQRAANIGTIDLVASYGANYTSGNISIPSNYETRAKSKMAGIKFTMPIFEGGLNNSRIREALDKGNKARAQLEEARRKAVSDARQAYAGIVNGKSQIEALQAAVEAGQSSLKGNKAGYRLGLRINSNVLDAEQQLYASRRDLTRARYETIMQGLKLKAAAGVLSGKDVDAINELLVH